MLERFEKSDGLGAIYPAMLNSIVALRCLGYSLDDPQMIRAMDEFEKLGIDCPEGDAGLSDADLPDAAMLFAGVGYGAGDVALGEAGVAADDPRHAEGRGLAAVEGSSTQRATGRKRSRMWSQAAGTSSSTMSFIRMWMIPAQVLLALNCVDNPRERYQYEVCQRAIDWILAMQCKNGGWAGFDKDNTKMIFQYIPFADHNAMLDPPTVDITGRMLEMLAQLRLYAPRSAGREGRSSSS